MDPVPWPAAWHEALYGPTGFYRVGPGPAAHFSTSTHGPLGAVFAEGIAALADAGGARWVLDVGAGRGELLAALHRRRPDLRLTGVDVLDRPAGLPDAVEWMPSPGGAALPDDLDRLDDVLVVAHEWLDVVPCTVAEVDDRGRLRAVLVDPATGEESLGGPLDPDDHAWCEAHWPAADLTFGCRVEVGLTRDHAWSGLLARIRTGTALAVDYGHTRTERPPHGTLVGYRAGAQVPPVPDGSCDVTAHVAVDSLEHDRLLPQAQALRELGVTPTDPAHATARTDPAGYLAALARASAVRALTAPGGLGGFHWVLRRCGRLTG